MRTVTKGAALVLLLSGCGVATSDRAEVASREEVPYGLLDPAATTTTSVAPVQSTLGHAWFVGEGHVLRVAREVAAPLSVDGLLDVLVAGPTEDEAAFGLRSAVLVDSVDSASVVAGVATVDLRAQFAAAPAREQILALAQLVYTVTEVASVAVVTFTLDGQPIDVPRADGSISEGPVTRVDYRTIAVER